MSRFVQHHTKVIRYYILHATQKAGHMSEAEPFRRQFCDGATECEDQRAEMQANRITSCSWCGVDLHPVLDSGAHLLPVLGLYGALAASL